MHAINDDYCTGHMTRRRHFVKSIFPRKVASFTKYSGVTPSNFS